MDSGDCWGLGRTLPLTWPGVGGVNLVPSSEGFVTFLDVTQWKLALFTGKLWVFFVRKGCGVVTNTKIMFGEEGATTACV